MKYLVAFIAGLLFGYGYFLWARVSLERALKKGKPGPFLAFLMLRLVLAGAVFAYTAWHFGQDFYMLALEVAAIFIGRKIAFKPR